MKKTALSVVGLFALTTVTLLFQNCTNKSFEVADLSSVIPKGTNLASNIDQGSGDQNGGGSGAVNNGSNAAGSTSNLAANLKVYDGSTGDGTKVTRIVQKIVGGGIGLRGCTGPMNNYYTSCVNDSEFVLITTAWGASSYDSASDTFSKDADISNQNWPFTSYYTRYILADGSRTEITFTPRLVNAIAVPMAAKVKMYDSSVGDGAILTHLTQRIVGAGINVRACTGPMNMYNTGCTKDSEFVLMTTAWGANSYDAATDTFSKDVDITTKNWPQTGYFTRFILADGSRTEATWTPSAIYSNKRPRLQWVKTFSQACVGPTPSPAPIGQPCSSEGDTRTNACGTATCQPSTDY